MSGKNNKDDTRMVPYTFRIHRDLLGGLREYSKTNRIPIGLIIRRLIEKFLKGEVGIE